jgi:hypothetical protein
MGGLSGFCDVGENALDSSCSVGVTLGSGTWLGAGEEKDGTSVANKSASSPRAAFSRARKSAVGSSMEELKSPKSDIEEKQ